MIEKTVRFGDGGRLVGTLTFPDARNRNGEFSAVILLNAGLLHRAGPYMLHVDLARELADRGLFCFRFDFSGIGDSAASKGSEDYEENALIDAAAAMDYVTARTGAKTFVIFGLCSGADNAHRVAVRDQRVAGAILLDVYGYPTLGFRMRDYAPGLLKPHKWLKYLKRFADAVSRMPAQKTAATSRDSMVDVFGRNWPSQKDAENEISAMVDRGAQLLYVYSGGVPAYYNYRNQFNDMFRAVDFKGKIRLDYFPKADHTYTRIEERRRLMECICSWMEDKFTGQTTK